MSYQTDAGPIAAAAISAAATIAAAQMAADAQRDANAKNLQGVQETNALRQDLYHQTRGSQGSAVLPEYQKPLEQQLSGDTAAAYRALQSSLGTPGQQVAGYQAISDRMQPSFDSGTALMDTIFNGQMTGQRLAEAAPVQTARENVATANRAAVMQSLRKRLSAVQAQQAQAGYNGSGSTVNKALFRETLGPMQQANTLAANAAYENALQKAQIQEQGRQLSLQSMDLPVSRAQQAVQLKTLPVAAVANTAQQLQSPMRFFYIGPGSAPQMSNPPPVSAVPGFGQIALQGIGGLSSSVGNLWANQNLARQYQNGWNSPNYGPNSVATPGGYTMADYQKQYPSNDSGGELGI